MAVGEELSHRLSKELPAFLKRCGRAASGSGAGRAARGSHSSASPLPISPAATRMLLKTLRRKARSTDTTSLY